MLYYCGFESFLKFHHKSGINNIFLRPLSDLRLDKKDKVISAYIGWCSLFLHTGDGQVVYLGYSNPKAQNSLPRKGSTANYDNQKTNRETNELIVCEKAPKYIINIECGSKETLILTLDLKLFKWTGFNFATSEPQPMLTTDDDCLPDDHQPSPAPTPPNVEQISVGVEYSAILTDTGDVRLLDIVSGQLIGGGAERLADGRKCVAIACGQEHLLALTDTGRVLSYGRGSRGQLGHGDLENVDQDRAQLIDALDGIRVKAIAAGGWHSMALSSEGDVYVWGWNESGQLGYSRDTLTMKALPLPLEISDDDSFSAISAGSRHSMAISENGILFGWGWNKWGQLGLDPKVYTVCDTPQVIPVDEKVKSICCKFWSSLIETEREPTPDD